MQAHHAITRRTLLHLAATAYANYETFNTIASYEPDIDTEARDTSAEIVQEISNKRERRPRARSHRSLWLRVYALSLFVFW